MKACPFCAEEIQDAAILCKHCGSDLAIGRTSVHRTTANDVIERPIERTINTPVAASGGAVQKIAIGVGVFLVLGYLVGQFGQSTDAPRAASASADATRAELLLKAIRGVGDSCDEVTRVFHQGEKPSTGDFWNVACRNGNSYMVQQQSSGAVKILDCKILKLLGGKAECFVAF